METEKKLIDEKFKFKLKTYLKFLIIEPWVTKFQMPNLRTINFIVLFLSAFFRWRIALFITIFLAIIFHMIGELKSGTPINWYRNYHYKKLRENGEKEIKEEAENSEELKDDKENNLDTANVS